MRKYFLPFSLLGTCFWLSCNLDTVKEPGPAAVAGFTITNDGCFAPCDVVFTNNSIDATSFEWDFGDGSPKVTQGSPTHRYELPGDYVVKLTATGTGGADTETKVVKVNALTFKKYFGGTESNYGRSVQQTDDGGFVLLGQYIGSTGTDEMQVVKTDKSGEKTWDQTHGASGGDAFGYSVVQTTNGGYSLLGHTNIDPAGQQMSLIRVKNTGSFLSRTTYGTNATFGRSVRETSDGGMALFGSTDAEGAGSDDMYLVKTNSIGSQVWKKTYGGTASDDGYAVWQTADGGYFLVGTTTSFGMGGLDVYAVKTDGDGQIVWEQTFGGTGTDRGYAGQQTADGGYIIAGATNSMGAGGHNAYLIKLNNAGLLVWEKTFGGAGSDIAWAVVQTADGGYALTGETDSFGAGGDDMYLVRTDSDGNLLWEKQFGGTAYDGGRSIQLTADGGFVSLGSTQSFGAGGYDFYLVKTDKDGNAQ